MSSLDCNNAGVQLEGLTIRQIVIISMFFRYYDYEFLLNSKFQITDVVNALFSKDGKDLNLKNIYSKSLLETLFGNKDNVVINETGKMQSLIREILSTKDKTEKFTKFNKLRKYINSILFEKEEKMYNLLKFINASFSDFFTDYYITNSVLENDKDKSVFINILLNLYKYLLILPNHAKIHNDSESLKLLQTQANSLSLHGKTADYLKGQLDQQRLSDFTSNDDVMVYITSIDSYYYIYNKYNIADKDLLLMLEMLDYLYELKIQNKNLQKFISEMANVLKFNIKQYYGINVDTLLD